MRFVIDMNLSPNWAVRLGQAGHDAVHWSAVGDDTAADADIAAWAHAEGRIVLTADRDFSVIVATSGSAGPSVVQLRCADLRVAAIGEATLAAIAEAEVDLTAGALLTFNGHRARIRPLPVERT